jgi:glutamine synthetase type III
VYVKNQINCLLDVYQQQEGVYNMIHAGQTIDLFKLQDELVNIKVDMAVSRTIDRVVDQISALRNDMNSQMHGLKEDMNVQIHKIREDMHVQIYGIREDMHGLRHEMRDRFVSLETRVTAVETSWE